MKCKLCNSDTILIHHENILGKYPVSYFQCIYCQFIQTEEPFWFKEAYQNAITDLDIGLISRNIYLKERIPPIIDNIFPHAKIMLDYGGGYGMFVRLMRDLGYNFFRCDLYCENLFAKHFDIADSGENNFDVLTAFEVFEHLADPVDEIQKMLSYSGNIIFTTELSPASVEEFKKWWYVAPSTGQHISFYSYKSLNLLAKKFDKYFYSNGFNLHIISNSKINDKLAMDTLSHGRKPSFVERILDRLNRHPLKRNSLLQTDYNMVLKALTNEGKVI